MKLSELETLISIKNYIDKCMDNYLIPKPKIKELNGIGILVNNKIVDIITSSEFKDYVGYENVDEAVKEAVLGSVAKKKNG